MYSLSLNFKGSRVLTPIIVQSLMNDIQQYYQTAIQEAIWPYIS